MNHERERPVEWLRQLREEPGQYAQLLASAGSMAVAAYRLARARCLVQPVWTAVPTVREIVVAAHEIAGHTGEILYTASLIADCEQAGLTVIQPMKEETQQCATSESGSFRFTNSRPQLRRGSSESTSTSSMRSRLGV